MGRARHWGLFGSAVALIAAASCDLPSCHEPTTSTRGPIEINDPDGAAGGLATPVTRPRRPDGPTFLGVPDRQILSTISSRRPVGARGTSGRSLSMFINLEGSMDAGFKPKTAGGQRWAGEVAAYRLARLLAIDRVPPAITRRFPRALFDQLLGDEPPVLARLDAEAALDPTRHVEGALSYWVPTIHPAEVDRLEELDRWTRWLRQGAAIPPERLGLAQQLSETIVFDYVTGNWDRWSRGNVFFGPDHTTLLLMDNNGAFNIRMSDRIRERNEAPLLQVERFGAGLYRRLVALSEADIREELSQDPAGERLLSAARLGAVLSRRDAVLQRVEGLIDEHGRDLVLCFP